MYANTAFQPHSDNIGIMSDWMVDDDFDDLADVDSLIREVEYTFGGLLGDD